MATKRMTGSQALVSILSAESESSCGINEDDSDSEGTEFTESEGQDNTVTDNDDPISGLDESRPLGNNPSQTISTHESVSEGGDNSDNDPDYDPTTDLTGLDDSRVSESNPNRTMTTYESSFEDDDNSDDDPDYNPTSDIADLDESRILDHNASQNLMAAEDHSNESPANTNANPTSDTSPIEADVAISDPQENDQQNLGPTTGRKSRKRTRNPELWACNVAKKQRCSGKEYIGKGGIVKSAREVKTLKVCTKCKYCCSTMISAEERAKIHHDFWKLNNDAKRHFYDMNTLFTKTASKRTKNETSRRTNSIAYFFTLNGRKIQVCKLFFCGTLDIGAKRVEYFHKNHKDAVTGTLIGSSQGQHTKKIISNDAKEGVRSYLNSLPRVESHYCRSSSAKEYLETGLNISVLYDRYLTWCGEKNLQFVKKHMFVEIFNTEFNMSFSQPKKDRCDLCEISKRQQIETGTIAENSQFESHRASVAASREERNKDRESEEMVICFDMQNVLTLPKAGISNFFYRRKLSCYNLTAHVSKDKSAYCCIWTEALCGRKGNDIASALVKILSDVVVRYPELKRLILWSDSCVPQNKNSIMSFAIRDFMNKHPAIESIIQKFSTRGHSCIQEVDSVHSVIERNMNLAEVYSPVSLVRLLTKLRKRGKVHVIQMRRTDFKDYQNCSKTLHYKDVPYSDLRELQYLKSEPFHVDYKMFHGQEPISISIRPKRKTRKNAATSVPVVFPDVVNQQFPSSSLLSKEKIKDIQAMLDYLPLDERLYMKAHCGLN